MNSLAGTWRLTRLAARRDRVQLSVWVLGMSAFLVATTAMFVNTLRTAEDVAQEAAIPTNSPGLRMLGLTSGPSVGGATMMRDFVLLASLAAMMSVLSVVRNTRQNEELGRSEVVGSAVVGRRADLCAAVIVAGAANLVLALTLGLTMVVNSQPVAGSFVAGSAVAAVGLVFTGVAAVTVQLASTARGAIGLAGGALGASFLLSGLGNMLGTPDPVALRVTSAWPSWLSPIGWGQQMRPFGGDHWWPLLLFLVLAGCLLTTAWLLVARRDVGAGLWPQRQGHAHASSGMLGPEGLAFRLQRGALLGWTIGLLAFGLIFGAMSEQVQDVSGGARDWYARVAGSEHILDAFQASMAGMSAMFVALYLAQMLLRLHADEAAGTVESLLAAGVTRRRWVVAQVINTLGGSLVLLAVFAVAFGMAAGVTLGDTGTHVRRMLAAGLVQVPALLLLGAAIIAVTGLLPRLSVPLAWGLVLLALMVGPMFGPPLGLSDAILDLSPFTHVPQLPAAEFSAAPLLVLTGSAVALALVGTVALRRRDLRLPA